MANGQGGARIGAGRKKKALADNLADGCMAGVFYDEESLWQCEQQVVLCCSRYLWPGGEMNRKKGNGLFDWEELRYAWHFHRLAGVIRWFARELRFAGQRIRQGYCDMDAWNLYHWFLDVIPDMIQDLRDNGTGFPCSEGPTVSRSISVEAFNRVTGDNRTESDEEQKAFQSGLVEWHAILDRMIFLFHEADEERCERKNSHEETYWAAYREFIEKYGMFGEKLRKPEDENSHGHRLYTLRDVDEYRDIAEEYLQESREIDRYRVKCKDEAFQLFCQWFYGLWD